MPQKRPNKLVAEEPTAGPTASTTAVTPTVVTVMAGPPPPPATRADERAKTPQPPASYVSPLKKLRKTMSRHERRVIDTIDGLRDFIAYNDMSDPKIRTSIRVQARLLWTATESVRGLHFLRLYLGEQEAPEPLHQQQQARNSEYQEAQREDPFEANQFLITLSLYEVADDDPDLPSLGSVIAFTPTKLRLYRNCCQVDAKLQGITTVVPP